MNTPWLLTMFESLYLLYMFFLFKTKHEISMAPLDRATQSLGSMFVHSTGVYENKVCLFGKYMAIFAILFFVFRTYSLQRFPSMRSTLLWSTIVLDTIFVLLAFFMNWNVLLYILPLILVEIYVFV